MQAHEYTLAMEAAKLRAQRLRREAAEEFWGEVARSLRNAWGRAWPRDGNAVRRPCAAG